MMGIFLRVQTEAIGNGTLKLFCYIFSSMGNMSVRIKKKKKIERNGSGTSSRRILWIVLVRVFATNILIIFVTFVSLRRIYASLSQMCEM